MNDKLSIFEVFGLSPLDQRLREAWFMLRGDPYTPPSRFGLSSLKLLRPRLSIACYLGQRRPDRKVPITNFFNHTPTPIEDGWSVRMTQVRDFRGGSDTYDSHNGTDFAVPPGTVVVAPASGRVLRVSNEFHRGGLKVFIDHGYGLVTTSNHLGRSLVQLGQTVAAGDPIALSGSSGVDCVTMFPWAAPHVHFNVWLNGKSVDPFAVTGEISLWLQANDPQPLRHERADNFQPTAWDHDGVLRAINSCRDQKLRAELLAEPNLELRAMNTLFNTQYFPTRFDGSHNFYRQQHPRRPMLSLPFRNEDFDGVILPWDPDY